MAYLDLDLPLHVPTPDDRQPRRSTNFPLPSEREIGERVKSEKGVKGLGTVFGEDGDDDVGHSDCHRVRVLGVRFQVDQAGQFKVLAGIWAMRAGVWELRSYGKRVDCGEGFLEVFWFFARSLGFGFFGHGLIVRRLDGCVRFDSKSRLEDKPPVGRI